MADLALCANPWLGLLPSGAAVALLILLLLLIWLGLVAVWWPWAVVEPV